MPQSRLKPRFADRTQWNLILPSSYCQWLDDQRTHVLPTRAAVLRDLIARAMEANASSR